MRAIKQKSEQETPKRGPGRPRKNPLPDASSPKRGPGRPKKEQPTSIVAIKKGPGRPPKTSAVTAEITQNHPTVQTRKPKRVVSELTAIISVIQDGNFTVAICQCIKDGQKVRSAGFSKYNPNDLKYVVKGLDGKPIVVAGKPIVKSNPYNPSMGKRVAIRRAAKKMRRGEYIQTEEMKVVDISNLDDIKF